MRAGAAVISSAAFGGIGASLAAILLSRRCGASAVGMGATILNSFGHDRSPLFHSEFLPTLSIATVFDAGKQTGEK